MPRKQAFSGKQKKRQLQERRDRKKDARGFYDEDSLKENESAAEGCGQGQARVLHIHDQPTGSKDFNPNKFRLQFLKMSEEEMKKKKTAARKPIAEVTKKTLEVSVESVYTTNNSLDFPKRPPWDFRLSKTQLERQEQSYFTQYVQALLTSHNAEQLSYFELNLETWRQLWRVTEMSDILLLIADIRHPALHLPPSLYRYLREELKRDVVLVLNKVDLASPALVAAWRAYLKSVYPEAHVVCFSSFPKTSRETSGGLHSRHKKKSLNPLGPQQLLDVCRELVQNKVNVESWQEKLDAKDTETSAPERRCRQNENSDLNNHSADQSSSADTDYSNFAGVYQRFRDGILTIGCIGYPNVGKSSLLNGLVGKKVVSVSKTPGHTKHLQTIFLTPTVKLCDCPGLVFPSYVDKALQILSGIFPIAQVREPYSTVGYLAQRLNLPWHLRLVHPDKDSRPANAAQRREPVKWSAFDICESWAVKCGYFTAKASRPDVYRAANLILRMAVEGKLCLCLAPPDYFGHEDLWKADSFSTSLAQQLAGKNDSKEATVEGDDTDSESDSWEQAQGSDANSSDEEEEERAVLCVDKNPFALLSDD